MNTPLAKNAPVVNHPDPTHTRNLRLVFWQNVVQQILTAFPKQAQMNPDLTDGRIAVLTHGGERVGIKAVYPLFACSINVSASDRALSQLVQCTVFEVHTPEGEVVTLPLSEIRGIHSLSEDLVMKLKAMNDSAAEGVESEPFGFAAFTSLAREEREQAAREAKTKEGSV